MAIQNPAVSNAGELTKRSPNTVGTTSSAVALSTSDGDVLLVDDERSTARLLESWLSEEFAIRTASTTERALEEVATSDIDVVVVANQWLHDSDHELFGRLRQTDETCRSLLLLASAETLCRADHSVQLPADRDTVFDAITTARQVGAYEQTRDTLLSHVDRRRVPEHHSHIKEDYDKLAKAYGDSVWVAENQKGVRRLIKSLSEKLESNPPQDGSLATINEHLNSDGAHKLLSINDLRDEV